MLFGHGGGVVLLKRLADAPRRRRPGAGGDPRLRRPTTTASSRSAFSAPSVEGQAEVLTEAWGAAGVDPGTLSYIEAHGTGTRMGDSIEVQALTRRHAASHPAPRASAPWAR